MILIQVAARTGGDRFYRGILLGGSRQHQHTRLGRQFHSLPARSMSSLFGIITSATMTSGYSSSAVLTSFDSSASSVTR